MAPKVFLDASVIIAGIKRPIGGSGVILKACQKRKIEGAVSRIILKEVEKNILEKFGEEFLLKYYRWLGQTDLRVVRLPKEEEIEKFRSLIATKDVHVLATAVKSRADFVLTLDRKHFMTPKIKKAKLPIRILLPGDFLQKVLKS